MGKKAAVNRSVQNTHARDIVRVFIPFARGLSRYCTVNAFAGRRPLRVHKADVCAQGDSRFAYYIL